MNPETKNFHLSIIQSAIENNQPFQWNKIVHYDCDDTWFCKENELKGAIHSMLSNMTAKYGGTLFEWFDGELLTESFSTPTERTLTKLFGDGIQNRQLHILHIHFSKQSKECDLYRIQVNYLIVFGE